MANIEEVRASKIGLYNTTTLLAALAAIWLGMLAIPSAKAQSLTVLYSFKGGSDGAFPAGGLVIDQAGNLYGTTVNGGGPNGCGTVFKIDTSGTETVLYRFCTVAQGKDGASPAAALIMDQAGNLYGTTSGGGATGNGTVFKIDTAGNETVLYSFRGGLSGDGARPFGALITDKAGNRYGTTSFGGAFATCGLSGSIISCGTVFKLDTSGNETVLYSFRGSSDGGIPNGGVIMDQAGNLYGTTSQGGAFTFSPCSILGCGTVFKLDPSGNETVLHNFTAFPRDGEAPQAALIMDQAGNLYGTTSVGGGGCPPQGCTNGNDGTVFKVDTSGNETMLYIFKGPPGDGEAPQASVAMDQAGNLYGTTLLGGAGPCVILGTKTGCGALFKLDASGNETVLHSFTGSFTSPGDGGFPQAGLIIDHAGNLYGTTSQGGAFGFGTVFKMTPAIVQPPCPTQVFVSAADQYMQATFIPPNSETLVQYAAACNFDHFNWQQQITILPGPSPFFPNEPFLMNPENLAPDNSLMAPPPFFDPPQGGYTYLPIGYDPFPFYYPSAALAPGVACTIRKKGTIGGCPPFPFVVNGAGTTLSMVDAPADHNFLGLDASPNPVPGEFMAFSSGLVGVDFQGNPHTLHSWNWNSTFNGKAGGVSQTASIYPIDPGSGTGGVTITSIDGVPQKPPSVTCMATPNTLWPPDGKTVEVTVSGLITAGTQGIPAGGTTFAVADEYKLVQPSGSFTADAGGSYSFTVPLIAARDGNDRDGRTYSINAVARDNIGNVGSCSSVVTVPHDQSDR
jgi:uncharacterized repeat protein (TIGR03803 family)